MRLSERVAARGYPGDEIAAEGYKATSLGMRKFIAYPRGRKNDPALVEVRRVGDRFELTPRAAALQKQGCEQRYNR